MSRFTSLHNHSHYSLLDGVSKPADIARRCVELGYSSIALTDHGNIGGAVEFYGAIKKQGLKPILGIELYICEGDPKVKGPENGRPYHHLCVIARNRRGWENLIRMVSESNHSDYFYYQPRLSVEALREFAGDGSLVAFSGHPGSELANAIFYDQKAAYACDSYDTLKSHHIRSDAKEKLTTAAERLVSVFGKDSFFLEVQMLNPEGMPAATAIAKALRWLSPKLGIPCIATGDSHYVRRQDAIDQRVLLCSRLRTTFNQVRRRIENEEDVELGGFFKGNHFHIPSVEELLVHNVPAELEMAAAIADSCDTYDIFSQPKLPKFPSPSGLPNEVHLRELAESGFRRLIEDRSATLSHSVDEYRARLDRELSVIEGAGLSSYFLIVQDIVNYGRTRGFFMGPGRGSAAGCLLSYLTGITAIDPLPYNLIFERFYNDGRNSPGRISMPDIDIDVGVTHREDFKEMLRKKYGADRVAKISTFNSLQGRLAIDEVLSVHEINFETRKEITKFIPDKARISDELQDMVDAGEDPSVIKYALEHNADDLSEWVVMDDNGDLHGEFAPYFAQAIRLEGTKKNVSVHAAGIVIADEPIGNFCPTYMDGDELTAAMDKEAVEKLGGVKIDILGVAVLDKAEGVRNLLRYGEVADRATGLG